VRFVSTRVTAGGVSSVQSECAASGRPLFLRPGREWYC
jgi:hypothetical protein